jgi:hypothetical protein
MEGAISTVPGTSVVPGERYQWPDGYAGWLVTERMTFPDPP